MGRVRWRPSMAIDGGLIDEDHRHLIDIVNRYDDALARGGSGLADAADILQALKFYADTHLEREEWLQRLVGFPGRQAHHDGHRELMARLDGIMIRTVSATASSSAEVVRDLRQLLRGWLLQHILTEDLPMKRYGPLMQRHAARLPDLKTVTLGPR
jgi:hemerythrin